MNALRSILVHLDGTARAEVRLRVAHQLAGAHRAELNALFAVAPRHLPQLPLAGGVPSMPMPAEINPDHLAHAMALFERTRDAGAPAINWQALNGEPVIESFVQRALLCDLLVLGQRAPTDATGHDVPGDFIESVLIDSGRPALIVPYAGEASATPQTVLIAWKPTRESAHALTAALPFLQQAKRVHAVCAADASGDTRQALPRLARYLRVHGVESMREHSALAAGDAGDRLLSLAADVGAEMIVMGCYGHTRAREFVLGGVSRTVLETMTVPVLMAH
ncbi:MULTISPECIES: universal stress protein [unclassified Variovorax]|uniref:universal stress protein n=1 Tax=unclassified Variovorax TaxID=663243 RepID=UPI003ECE2A7B